MKKAIEIFFLTVFTYVLVEGVCFVFIKTGYIPAQLPSFKFYIPSDDRKPIYADLNPIWGAWHMPGDAVSEKECFRVTYKINSYGARDRERQMIGSCNRVVVLGDSFLEGYGVNEEQRATNLLEKESGIEFLNFASSGFGSTQEYLIYKHLAKKFTHDNVLIGILPFNDFLDDDYEYCQKFGKDRYRPFWVGNAPDYSLRYFVNHVNEGFTYDKGEEAIHSFKGKAASLFMSYSYLFNVYLYLTMPQAEIKKSTNVPYSGFYDYSRAQLNRLTYSLKKIKEEGADKKVFVFLIPVQMDFNRYLKEKEVSKLGKDLEAFCKNNDIQFLDLLPQMYNDKGTDVSGLFLSCDGHWNADGNEYVKNQLIKFLNRN